MNAAELMQACELCLMPARADDWNGAEGIHETCERRAEDAQDAGYCVGSGQVLAFAAAAAVCPVCGRNVATARVGMASALISHYPPDAAPPAAGRGAAPTMGLGL